MVEKAKKEEKEETTMSPQLQEIIDREDWTKAVKYCTTRKWPSQPFAVIPIENRDIFCKLFTQSV